MSFAWLVCAVFPTQCPFRRPADPQPHVLSSHTDAFGGLLKAVREGEGACSECAAGRRDSCGERAERGRKWCGWTVCRELFVSVYFWVCQGA